MNSRQEAFLTAELWRELVAADAVEVVASGVRLTRPVVESRNTGDRAPGRQPENRATLSRDSDDPRACGRLEGVELATLRRAATLGEAALLDAVDEATHTGLIEDVPSRGLAYRFTHELVRRSVLDRLSAPRRAELHLRIAEALAGPLGGQADRARLAALAHHFTEAAPLGDSGRAVTYNILAAESAADALCFDEAASRLQPALELGIADPKKSTETYLALGVELYRAGRSLESLAAFRQAAERARAMGDGELFARAAIGFESACWRPGLNDQDAVVLLTEAVELLGPEDSAIRSGS